MNQDCLSDFDHAYAYANRISIACNNTNSCKCNMNNACNSLIREINGNISKMDEEIDLFFSFVTNDPQKKLHRKYTVKPCLVEVLGVLDC